MKINPFPHLTVKRQGPAERYTLEMSYVPAGVHPVPLLTTYAGDLSGEQRAEYAVQAINGHAILADLLRRAADLIADLQDDRYALTPHPLRVEIEAKLATL